MTSAPDEQLNEPALFASASADNPFSGKRGGRGGHAPANSSFRGRGNQRSQTTRPQNNSRNNQNQTYRPQQMGMQPPPMMQPLFVPQANPPPQVQQFGFPQPQPVNQIQQVLQQLLLSMQQQQPVAQPQVQVQQFPPLTQAQMNGINERLANTQCYNCKDYGHYAKFCPMNRNPNYMPVGGGPSQQNRDPGNGAGRSGQQ